MSIVLYLYHPHVFTSLNKFTNQNSFLKRSTKVLVGYNDGKLKNSTLAQNQQYVNLPYSRLFSCGFNFQTAGAGRKLDFEKFFLPI